MKKAGDYNYLIIGGVPKAGTTSLFKYLADHPQVCASSLKETRFFLDPDYPLPVAKRFDGTNLEAYTGFFPHFRAGEHRLMIEATPDYLYSRSALRIAELLPHAKIIFILRDPVDRLVSWYKYACQRGLIQSGVSFEAYVKSQIDRPITPDTPTCLRALDQGRFEKYLPGLLEAFGERILTIRFEDLINDSRRVMDVICEFGGLDASFYNQYQFTAENVSHAVRSVWIDRTYRTLRRGFAFALHDHPMLKDMFKLPNRLIKRLLKGNLRTAEEIVVPPWLAELIIKETKSGT
jgi:hypothetical protein